MFNIFKRSADRKFSKAVTGIEKYVAQYEEAAKAAEQELIAVAEGLTAKVAKLDTKSEKALVKYKAVVDKTVEKTNEATVKAELRKMTLKVIAAKATTAVNNHKSIYLS